jgi:hypothetical protein
MKSIVFIILLNLLFISCTKDNDPVQPIFDDRRSIEKFAFDYSENNYFVDSIYTSRNPGLNLFEKYYGNINPWVEPQYRIKEIEVWKTAQGYIDPLLERTVNAFIDIPSKEAGHYPLDSPLRDSDQVPNPENSIIRGRFIKFEEGIDYEINNYCGLLIFKDDIPHDIQIAIAFRLDGEFGDDNDLFYGEFTRDLPTDTIYTLLLKLVKPKNLQPSFIRAWKNRLKNIYSLNANNIIKKDFEVNIYYKADENTYLKAINGTPLIEYFGLDKMDEEGNPNPDGKFDFIPGKTIMPDLGYIIFPKLEPFGSDLPRIFNESLQQNDIYDTTKTFAAYSPNSKNFKIEVKFNTRDD